ncbi:MAG: TonB-dependent receptor [Bacteroidales bacterium]|jgi:iron complex outermembrane receptor protein|nr:TonB-dependent receptor [Bacteroidales bacterium]
MRIGYFPVLCGLCCMLHVNAQETDSTLTFRLNGVDINDSYEQSVRRRSVMEVHVAGADFLREHFTGSLVQALEHMPGIHSMDIGSGFSKPVIRGMGFNRISVTENGIKQEGQQWGADHGLEADAFGVERVIVRKGPASLLYGSDAMGGAIEISQLPPPSENSIFGEVALLGKSVSDAIGESLMLGFKKDKWHAKIRYSGQDFGDYRIPTDTVVYLTQLLPIYGRRLKNTAGFERDASLYAGYRKGAYLSDYAVSNVYQKTGFFAGAHGIPDASRLQDDGNPRDAGLPYSTVNHLKVSMRQQYTAGNLSVRLDAGYQNNHREEWSLFHTHYGTQPAPEHDPDKELVFDLQTYSLSAKLQWTPSSAWEHTAGWEVQYQRNRIAGYSFLLPEYRRFAAGLFWLAAWHPRSDLSVSGGVRYDEGRMNVSAYTDAYLEAYLVERGYTDEMVAAYRWRSYPARRRYGNISGSLGMVWHFAGGHQLKANIGRSFRLPGAHELASNGVHHGTFRHEQGDPSLSSERGWQLDVSYTCEHDGLSFSVSPFASWFGNYIYLKPTGKWSALPHAGQVYLYTGAKALFAGGETTVDIDFLRWFAYRASAEYVYTCNLDERVALSFSPPASMRHAIGWKGKHARVETEWQLIAAQRRTAKNEDATAGAHLFHVRATARIPLGKINADVTLSLHNLLNRRYYHHLSFYRKVEIPEPGRNFQIFIKIPFQQKIK